MRATRTHPGGVLLPATFMTAERVKGRWRPDSHTGAATPQHARDSLTFTLRVADPVGGELGAEERARRTTRRPTASTRCRPTTWRWRAAASGSSAWSASYGSDPTGRKGRAPPTRTRSSPSWCRTSSCAPRGLISDEEDDAPVVLDEHTQRLADLFHEEEARLRVLRDREKERAERPASTRGDSRPGPAE